MASFGRWAIALALGFSLSMHASVVRAAASAEYCNVADIAVPVRQTLIILDEFHVMPETGERTDARNEVWRKFLANFLFPEPRLMEQYFLPRERVTVLLARKDGSGVRTVFSNCLPFFSAEEKLKIAQKSGAMQALNRFIGSDPVTSAKKDMQRFNRQLSNEIRAAIEPSMMSPATTHVSNVDLASNGLIRSLKQGNLVEPAYGIPRIVIFSEMSRFLANSPQDLVQVRQLGLEQARVADLNFGMAEVYVVGMSGNPVARAALETFFLASYGELIGTGPASTLPTFAPAPTNVRFYQGIIAYPAQQQYPIRLRVATGKDGTVVNSWLSVRTSKDQFSPFHGVLTCDNEKGCTYLGDDNFSKAWNTRRSISTDPDPALPFAGASALKFTTNGRVLKGSISDPRIRFSGMKNFVIEFTAERKNVRF